MHASASGQPGEPQLPDVSVRTWVSLLLVAHLFMVAVALSAYTNPSPLQRKLRTSLSPYLRTLNFDLTHPYDTGARLHLGYEADTDYSVTVSAKLPDGSVENVTVPQPDVWPHQRYLRYQALANVAGVLIEGQLEDSELPKSIGAAILDEQQATRGTVRCRANAVARPEDPDAPGAAAGPLAGQARDIYEADLMKSDGRTELLKKSSAGEVAPVEKKKP